MFLAFLPPIGPPKRYDKSPYLWVFYRLLSSDMDCAYIGSSDYFQSPVELFEQGRPELKPEIAAADGYKIPTQEALAQLTQFVIPEDICQEIGSDFKGLITQTLPRLGAFVAQCIKDLMAKQTLDAIILWCNCATVEAIAAELNVKVIHCELGPLRRPDYIHTNYLDFQGVNGGTQAAARYKIFRKEHMQSPVSTFSRQELNYIFRLSPHLPLQAQTSAQFEVGLALQVSDDSNIIAYSRGWDSKQLVEAALKAYEPQNILVRSHPADKFELDNFDCIVDSSVNSIEFIQKCDTIWTINSSVALEALLLGRRVRTYGDCPVNFIIDLDESEQILALNFYLFCYLIPSTLLFDKEYYLWRLSKPDERSIWNRHLAIYLREIATYGQNMRNAIHFINSDLTNRTFESSSFVDQPPGSFVRPDVFMIRMLANIYERANDLANETRQQSNTIKDLSQQCFEQQGVNAQLRAELNGLTDQLNRINSLTVIRVARRVKKLFAKRTET